MTVAYVLTEAAEADVRGIVRYTRNQWGDAQTRRYMEKLERGIERLAAGQGVFKDMSGYAWRAANITMSSACRARMRPC